MTCPIQARGPKASRTRGTGGRAGGRGPAGVDSPAGPRREVVPAAPGCSGHGRNEKGFAGLGDTRAEPNARTPTCPRGVKPGRGQLVHEQLTCAVFFYFRSQKNQPGLFMAIGANAHLRAQCSCWMDVALTPRLGRVSHLRESRVQSCREGFHVPWGGKSGSGTLARCVSGGGGVSSLRGQLALVRRQRNRIFSRSRSWVGLPSVQPHCARLRPAPGFTFSFKGKEMLRAAQAAPISDVQNPKVC